MSGELEHSESWGDFGYCKCIKATEVIRMMRGRATRSDEISVDFWKNASKASMQWAD